MNRAAALRSRLLPATAYLNASAAARDLRDALDAEDIPGALYAVALWAAWINASRKDLPQ